MYTLTLLNYCHSLNRVGIYPQRRLFTRKFTSLPAVFYTFNSTACTVLMYAITSLYYCNLLNSDGLYPKRRLFTRELTSLTAEL